MYYVYLLIDPRTGLPFYAGKGKGRRANKHIISNQRGNWTENRYKDNVIRQILSEGLIPTIEYIFWEEDEKAAYDYEEDIIKKYGRKLYDQGGILTNICKDNRPPRNEYTPERKQEYRERMLGNTLRTGIVQSEEEKKSRSIGLQRAWGNGERQVTDRMREAARETHSGKIITDITRGKQRAAAKELGKLKLGKTNEEIFGKEIADEIRRKKEGRPPPNRKSIIVNGITYESIRKAAQMLNTSEYKVQKMVD